MELLRILIFYWFYKVLGDGKELEIFSGESFALAHIRGGARGSAGARWGSRGVRKGAPGGRAVVLGSAEGSRGARWGPRGGAKGDPRGAKGPPEVALIPGPSPLPQIPPFLRSATISAM